MNHARIVLALMFAGLIAASDTRRVFAQIAGDERPAVAQVERPARPERPDPPDRPERPEHPSRLREAGAT